MLKKHTFSLSVGEAINTFVIPFVFTDKIVEAVKSIWRCHKHEDHRLILIDNTSEEFTERKWLEENSHFYIRSYRNVGPAVAFNIGIKIAHTKYVTVTSDDARVIHGCWFNQSVNQIQDSDTIVSLNSIHQHRVPKEDFYNPIKQYSEQDYSDLDKKYGMKRELFGLALAIGKKETFIKSGLFPEDRYIYWIDGMFAQRARDKGVNCIGSGVIFHYGDASHKGRLVAENKFDETITKEGVINL